MGSQSEDALWRGAVITAITALRDGRLASSVDARPIILPGVIGLLGVTSMMCVTEPVSAERLADEVDVAEPASFVLILDGLPTELEDALISRGWSFRRRLEMMVLTSAVDDAAVLPDLGVSIETIDEANVAEAQALSDAVFGFPSDLRRMINSHAAGGQIARDRDGQTIAMGGWQKAGDGVRIASIATRPEHRGRGLGGLMTLVAVNRAQRAGAQFSYLEATSEGAGVYRRVGFRTLGYWRVFHRLQSHPRENG